MTICHFRSGFSRPQPKSRKNGALYQPKRLQWQCGGLVCPFPRAVFAKLDQIGAMKADRVDHIALYPAFLAPPSRQRKWHINLDVEWHHRIGRRRAEGNHGQQLWPIFHRKRQNDTRPALHHLWLNKSRLELYRDQRTLERMEYQRHSYNIDGTTRSGGRWPSAKVLMFMITRSPISMRPSIVADPICGSRTTLGNSFSRGFTRPFS